MKGYIMIEKIEEKTGNDLHHEIESIKASLMLREISYEKAVAEIEPVIDEVNRRAKKIAKKYNKRYYALTVSKALR